MKPERKTQLERTALTVRKDIVRMIGVARAGHLLSSLSIVDLLVFLYWEVMNVRPDEPLWPERDRFVLSKGHGCAALYAVLAGRGFFDREELWNYRRLGSMLQGHPEYLRTPGVDTPSGSMGMGMGIASGMALALRSERKDCRVFTVVGDGELQEGSIWESAMTAGHWGISTLTAVIDMNGTQMEGTVGEIKGIEPVGKKFEAFGWSVFGCDGHDFDDIQKAFQSALSEAERPSIVLAETRTGKGVSIAEKGNLRPAEPLSRNDMEEALRDLESRTEEAQEEGTGDDPFEKYP